LQRQLQAAESTVQVTSTRLLLSEISCVHPKKELATKHQAEVGSLKSTLDNLAKQLHEEKIKAHLKIQIFRRINRIAFNSLRHSPPASLQNQSMAQLTMAR